MKFSLIIIIVILISFSLTSCSLPFFPVKKAGLSVTATPNAGVFLNDKHVGSTPYYNEKMKSGEYTIKIVPESGVGMTWESKVSLLPGIMTVISRQLGQTDDSSSGYFLTLQPGGIRDGGSIEVVTVPDKSVVNIDGESKGFSPIALDNISAGEHVVLITAPGFIDRSINANLRSGHILKASIQLAKSEVATSSAENITNETIDKDETIDQADETLDDNASKATSTPQARSTPKSTSKPSMKPKPITNLKTPYVTVLESQEGYLNVREDPTTAENNIIVKIKPGESYKYLEKNTTGWYKIEISPGEEGWVSSKYVKLVEE